MIDVRRRVAFDYGAVSFFTVILHNVFLIYHIDVYVNVLKIDKVSFWIGEAIFLVWNSVNDPLFGWLSDYKAVAKKPSNTIERKENGTVTYGASPDVIVGRIETIGICGPLLAFSFILLWTDWHLPWLQFAICLCLYDAFLTVIDLQCSALLAELSISAEERNLMNRYQSAFSALGCVTVFISYYFWDKSNLSSFRVYCTCLAVIAAVGFYTVAISLKASYLQNRSTPYSQRLRTNSTKDYQQMTSHSWMKARTIRLVLKQIILRNNFITCTLINVIQVFHCHFNSNFFPLFLETLLNKSSHAGPFLIGISFILPHLNNIFFLYLSTKHGVYRVIQFLFILKLTVAVCMWIYGDSYVWLLYLFISCNRIFTEGTCNLMSLVISDLVDEDFIVNQREEPLSAFIFGVSNLMAKPGQTLAPIVGTTLISLIAGRDVFLPSSHSNLGITAHDQQNTLYKEACFSILVMVPMFCATIQIAVWSLFRLHGAQLKTIRLLRATYYKSLSSIL